MKSVEDVLFSDKFKKISELLDRIEENLYFKFSDKFWIFQLSSFVLIRAELHNFCRKANQFSKIWNPRHSAKAIFTLLFYLKRRLIKEIHVGQMTINVPVNLWSLDGH